MSYDLPLDEKTITADFQRIAIAYSRKFQMDYSDALFCCFDSLARSVIDYDASRGGWQAFYATYAVYSIRKHFTKFRSVVSGNNWANATGKIAQRLSGEETDAVFAVLYAEDERAEQDDTALDRLDALRASLASLSAKDRELILRYYDRGETLESIGADEGKRRQTIHCRLAKARKKLESRITEIMATRPF